MRGVLKTLAIVAALMLAMPAVVHAHGPNAPPPGPAGVATPVGAPAATPAPSPNGGPAPGAPPAPGGGATGGGNEGGTTGGSGGSGGGWRGPGAGPQKAKVSGGAGRTTTKWGRQNRSPAVYRILDMHWIDASWPTSTKAGYANNIQPLSDLIHQKCFDGRCVDINCSDHKCTDKDCMRDKKPAMVYIYDPKAKREAKLEAEKVMFGNDDVVAATNWLHCFHMAADETEMAQYKANFGTKLPALVFLSPTGKTVEVLEGKISQKQVMKGMDKVFSQCFGENLARNLKTYKTLLKKLEKAEDDVAKHAPRLRDLQFRLNKKYNKTLALKLEQTRAKYNKAVKTYQKLELDRAFLLSKKIVDKKEVAKK